jgi:hypothetical protein
MRKIALFLCFAAFIAWWIGKRERAKHPAADLGWTIPTTPSIETTAAQEPVVENFDRIPADRIDSALAAYEGGDTLSKDSIGNNECLGMPVHLTRLKNHLTLTGVDNPYEWDWSFEGKFHPVLGLEPGMSRDRVRRQLGRPHSSSSDSMVFYSTKATDYDSANFDARWEIHIEFHGDSLKAMAFEQFYDDC